MNKWYFRLSIVLLLVILLVPPAFFREPQPGLDSSWHIAINLAIKQHLVFGKDFVFTYGPLGIISTRLPIGVGQWAYILLDVYMLGTLFAILWTVYKTEFKVLTVVFVFLLVNLSMYEMAHLWFFIFFLYHICTLIKSPFRYSDLIQASILSLVSFYCKISLGIIAIFIFIGTICWLLASKKLQFKIVLTVLSVYVNLILASAMLLNVDLLGYVSSSFQLIDSYNDAMLRPITGEYTTFFYLALMLIAAWMCYCVFCLIYYIRARVFVSEFQQMIVIGIASIFIYLLFKNGFVRGETHTTYFFKGISFAFALTYLFSNFRPVRMAAGVLAWIGLAISFYVVEAIPGSYKPAKRIYTLGFISNKYHELGSYYAGLGNYQEFMANPPGVSKSNVYRDEIGDHSVDIFPSEISLAYFNDLNYQPRPVIQSYAAYNGYLDSLNAARYNSNLAPEYLIFSLSTIDDRAPNFDESKTHLAIVTNYEFVREVKDGLLFRRNPRGRRIDSFNQNSFTAKLGTDITIPEGNQLMFSKISVDYSAIGKVRRLLYKPPTIKITFMLDNGDQRTYTAIKPILEGGVLLNRFIDSDEEFNLLMTGYGYLNSRVQKVRFDAVDGENGFDETIKLSNTMFEISNTTREGIRRDSLHRVTFASRYKIEPYDARVGEHDTSQVVSFIENFQTHSTFFVKVSGWAFLKNQPCEKSKISVIAKSLDGKTFAMNTIQSDRPDVAGHFDRNDILRSGFSATATKGSLPAGTYTVGLLIEHQNGKAMTFFGDKEFTVRKFALIEPALNTRLTAQSSETLFNVESVKEYQTNVIVQGWAFLKGTDDAPKTRVLLYNDRNSFLATIDQTKRPDVASYLKVDAAMNAGFYTNILTADLPAGAYTIGVEITDASGKIYRALTDHKITVTKEAKPIEININDLQEAQFQASIDAVKKQGQETAVSGWAVTKPEEVKGNSVMLILKNGNNCYSFETVVTSRPDVTAYFKSKLNIDNCGFSVTFRNSDLIAGKYQLGVRVKSKEGSDQVMFLDQYLEVR